MMNAQSTLKRTLRSARFRAVGDLMFHDAQLKIARQPDAMYDFHPQFALIAKTLGNADYTIANLETTIGRFRDIPYSGFPRFNAPETLLDAIRDAGVDFLTLANNHILDRFFEGLVTTVDNVEAKGFDFGGANRTPEEKARPVVVTVNGISVGMLCYTELTNTMDDYYSPEAEAYGVNYLRCADYAADVQKLRDAGAEVIFAMPHWGEEFYRTPNENTVRQAKKMIAAGVDVILGSHPHMVQPVEYVKVKTADGGVRTGLVAYSLGNFISNMCLPYTDSGIVLDFTLRERPEGGFTVGDVSIVPVYCWRREDMIQPLCALKVLNDIPEGMCVEDRSWAKESCDRLRELIDDAFPLAEC